MKQYRQSDNARVVRDEPSPVSSRTAPNHPGGWVNQRLAHRIPELDGIRGLAILLVLIFHCVFQLVILNEQSEWQIKPLLLFRLSWSGVDLFFVLSGFLIGGILLDAKCADGYYRTFYFRRFYRIAPIYAILLILFAIGNYCVPSAATPLGELFNYREGLPLWSYLLFLQNCFMALHHSFGSRWMSVTWSLAVEEQFYLLLPFVVRRLSRSGIAGFAIGMIVVAPVLRGILERHAVSGLVFSLLPCRSDALGLGLLVAIACRNQTAWTWLGAHRRYVYAAFAVLGSGVLVWTLWGLELGYTWLAGFYTSLLVLVVVTPGRVERLVFRSSLLSRLGTVAYAVYLFHLGILWLFHYAFAGAVPSIHDLSTLCITLFSAGTVLLLSAISWRVLEKPLIKRAHSRYHYVSESPQPR
jgi:peptidoglycan/LPS O-acetylase OafA/YrhL